MGWPFPLDAAEELAQLVNGYQERARLDWPETEA